MSYVVGLECVSCGKQHSPGELRYRCSHCGGLLDPKLDYESLARSLDPDEIKKRPAVIWRKWWEFLPLEEERHIKRVSLGELETPLIESPSLARLVGVKQLYLKNDAYFPSCSLKDRSMPIVVAKGLEFGADTMYIVSSGNAAASLAAYCARAGTRAIIFMSEASVSKAKLAQTLLSGAKVILLQDDVPEDVVFELRDKHGWYDCNGQVNPFRLEGKKTYAHALWDQLQGIMPDRIVMPMAVGNTFVAIRKGLRELTTLGWIDKLPRLVVVQPEASAPIVTSYLHGREEVEPVERGKTICGISPGDPGVAGDRALRELREDQAQATVASDDELVRSVRFLAREGVYAEPAGALAFAGLLRLSKNGGVSHNEVLVVLVTGHGLKDTDTMLRICPEPVKSGPQASDIERALNLATASHPLRYK